MSKDTQTTISKFSIVRAISAFLKLGDDGKLDSFFTRVVKALSKEVAAHKKNLENLKFNHEQAIDTLKDKLEDAETALNESYLKVEVDQISTNEAQNNFMEIYLSNIDKHVLEVQKIEARIEDEKKSYQSAKEAIDKQIYSLSKRIKKISEE